MIKKRQIIIAFGVLLVSFIILAIIFIIPHEFPEYGESLKISKDVMFDIGTIFAIYILIIFIITFLLSVYIWMTEVEGNTILPFVNTTGNPVYDGKAISDLLIFELYSINYI